jgi:hypothetical protein
MNRTLMREQEIKEAAIRGQFTDKEWWERKRHVITLRSFAGASVSAANALAQIRDKKLYRPHATLKEFCRRECGWTEQRLFQIISFAKVRESLPTETKQLLNRESHARELVKLPEEKRVEVLQEAHRNGEITAKSIRKAAEVSKQKDADENVCDDLGYPVPKTALAYWNRKQEAKNVLAQISAARGQVKKLLPDDPMWSAVNLNGVIADLNSAFNRFAAAIPAFVCPYCDGENVDGCKCCKGKGVVSKFTWSVIPEEMRAKHQRDQVN